jgi:hypothetical protein
MNISLRRLLEGADLDLVELPDAFDGEAEVQDVLDAEYPWLDAEVLHYDLKIVKGKAHSFKVKIKWDFKGINEEIVESI